jgi:hypothetical protein
MTVGYIFVWTRSETKIIDRCAALLEKLWDPPVQHQRNFGSGTATHAPPPASRRHESDEEMARRLQDEENRQTTNGVRTRLEAYEHAHNTTHEEPIPSVTRTEISPEELRRRRMARFQNT